MFAVDHMGLLVKAWVFTIGEAGIKFYLSQFATSQCLHEASRRDCVAVLPFFEKAELTSTGTDYGLHSSNDRPALPKIVPPRPVLSSADVWSAVANGPTL